MQNHPDLPVVQADIDAVVAETGLSQKLVRRIHEHLVEISMEPPTSEDLRHYAGYGAEHLGEGGFRHYLEMPADPDHPPSPEALRLLEEWATEAEAWRKHRRGTWMAGGFWMAYLEACKRATPPFTPRSVAPHFDSLAGKRGIHPDHLRRLIRRFGIMARVDGRITVVYP
jgi:hypothetical protein